MSKPLEYDVYIVAIPITGSRKAVCKQIKDSIEMGKIVRIAHGKSVKVFAEARPGAPVYHPCNRVEWKIK